MARSTTTVIDKEKLKKSPKLQSLLGELLKNLPPPNGDLQWSLNRNRYLQEQLVCAALATAELSFPGIVEMVQLLAGKEQELLQKVGPQC